MNQFVDSIDTDEFSKEVLKDCGRDIKTIRIVCEEKIYVNNSIEHSVCSIKQKNYDIKNYSAQSNYKNIFILLFFLFFIISFLLLQYS